MDVWELQAGHFIKERGLVRQRMGQPFDALLDYGTALPLLKEKGRPVADLLFNRGFCQRFGYWHGMQVKRWGK